ncbi:MAG: hypothetical protein AAGA68_24950 [Pseudomonadota bacterium]
MKSFFLLSAVCQVAVDHFITLRLMPLVKLVPFRELTMFDFVTPADLIVLSDARTVSTALASPMARLLY